MPDDGHPFDARRQLLEDHPDDCQGWQVVSLITALRECVRRESRNIWRAETEERLVVQMDMLVGEITARGIDGSSLVRHGMMPELVVAVLGLLVDVPQDAGNGSSTALREEWLSSIEAQSPGLPRRVNAVLNGGSDEQFADLLIQLGSVVIPWGLSAPLQDLLALKAPEGAATSGEAPILDESVMLDYRWVVERFSTTRLQEWRTESLHREYRWLLGQGPPACALDLVSEREIDRHELADEIARRAVSDVDSQREPRELVGVEAGLAAQMVARASELLGQRRYSEAAALFEFVLTRNQKDPLAHNNLGFCLIPTDPARGLRELSAAADLGYPYPQLNRYNQAVAHWMLRDVSRSLDGAEAAWQGLQRNTYSLPYASLWIVRQDGVDLDPRGQLQRAVIELGTASARALGDERNIDLWLGRSQESGHSGS